MWHEQPAPFVGVQEAWGPDWCSDLWGCLMLLTVNQSCSTSPLTVSLSARPIHIEDLRIPMHDHSLQTAELMNRNVLLGSHPITHPPECHLPASTQHTSESCLPTWIITNNAISLRPANSNQRTWWKINGTLLRVGEKVPCDLWPLPLQCIVFTLSCSTQHGHQDNIINIWVTGTRTMDCSAECMTKMSTFPIQWSYWIDATNLPTHTPSNEWSEHHQTRCSVISRLPVHIMSCFTSQKGTKIHQILQQGAQTVFLWLVQDHHRNSAQYRLHKYTFRSIMLSFKGYKVNIITWKYKKGGHYSE
jgi:hypothetical protein